MNPRRPNRAIYDEDLDDIDPRLAELMSCGLRHCNRQKQFRDGERVELRRHHGRDERGEDTRRH